MVICKRMIFLRVALVLATAASLASTSAEAGSSDNCRRQILLIANHLVEKGLVDTPVTLENPSTWSFNTAASSAQAYVTELQDLIARLSPVDKIATLMDLKGLFGAHVKTETLVKQSREITKTVLAPKMVKRITNYYQDLAKDRIILHRGAPHLWFYTPKRGVLSGPETLLNLDTLQEMPLGLSSQTVFHSLSVADQVYFFDEGTFKPDKNGKSYFWIWGDPPRKIEVTPTLGKDDNFTLNGFRLEDQGYVYVRYLISEKNQSARLFQISPAGLKPLDIAHLALTGNIKATAVLHQGRPAIMIAEKEFYSPLGYIIHPETGVLLDSVEQKRTNSNVESLFFTIGPGLENIVYWLSGGWLRALTNYDQETQIGEVGGYSQMFNLTVSGKSILAGLRYNGHIHLDFFDLATISPGKPFHILTLTERVNQAPLSLNQPLFNFVEGPKTGIYWVIGNQIYYKPDIFSDDLPSNAALETNYNSLYIYGNKALLTNMGDTNQTLDIYELNREEFR